MATGAPSPRRRRIAWRIGAAALPALAVLAVATVPDRTRDAVAFLRSDPGAFWLDVSITPPTGDGWNPGFELRQVILHAGAGYIEPSGRWPSGAPLSIDVPLTAGEADRVILALGRDGFFEQAVDDPPSPIHAPCVIRVTGPIVGASTSPPDSSPRVYCEGFDWDARRIAGRLKAIRKAVDGEAATAIDQMIRQIPSVPR